MKFSGKGRVKPFPWTRWAAWFSLWGGANLNFFKGGQFPPPPKFPLSYFIVLLLLNIFNLFFFQNILTKKLFLMCIPQIALKNVL